MMFPTRRTVAAGVIFTLPLLLLAVHPEVLWVTLAADAFLLSLYLWERTQLSQTRITLRPTHRPSTRVGEAVTLTYKAINSGERAVGILVRQPLPEGWSVLDKNDDRVDAVVPARSTVELYFHAVPSRRGDFVFPEPELTVRGGRLVHAAPSGVAGRECAGLSFTRGYRRD